jgi:two-component system, response regulator RegA
VEIGRDIREGVALMKHEVLIVDDDAGTRVSLAAALRRCGYEIMTASGRAEAKELVEIARAKGYIIDIALVDIELPKMSGKELVAELKRMDPPVAVFIVSGFSDKVFIIDLLNRGEHSFIRKTIETQETIRRQEKRLRELDNDRNKGGVS